MNGAELRAWRTEAGYSQQVLALMLGVDVTTVSRWERNLRPISPAMVLALRYLQGHRELFLRVGAEVEREQERRKDWEQDLFERQLMKEAGTGLTT